MRLSVQIKSGIIDYDMGRLQEWASSSKDGRYSMELIPYDGVVANMMKYYRGVVLMDVADSVGNTYYEQHEINLQMFAPVIVSKDDTEETLRSGRFEKRHWLHFLNDIIHFYSVEGIYIRKAGESGHEEYN